MNFKPNAWTLLFALSLGALLYQMNTNNVKVAAIDESESSCTIPELAPSDFYVDYGSFLKYADFLDSLFTHGAEACPQFQDEFEKYANLLNPNVWSFKIPKCEMSEMIALNPDGEYYAYLIMKNPSTDSMMIDLAFSHVYEEGNPQSPPTMDNTLAAKGGGDGLNPNGFFDFTKPCPPICPEN